MNSQFNRKIPREPKRASCFHSHEKYQLFRIQGQNMDIACFFDFLRKQNTETDKIRTSTFPLEKGNLLRI